MNELYRIPLAKPSLTGREKEYVLECLESNWISSIGRFIREFEECFADYCGVKNAIATSNGTTALHLALVALGLKPKDEVLVPTLTYVATANAVRYCGAEPVLVDSGPNSLNLDVYALEGLITEDTRGIIPVHLYGQPAEMKVINALAREHGLWVLEDAAEAHGAEHFGRRIGSIGDCASFSFFGNKIVTTGEGGMVTTNDDNLAEKLRLFRGQGMDPERRYWFPVVGFNYRMTNIQAAIGLAQMERIDAILAERDQIAELYRAELARLGDRVFLLPETDGSKGVTWAFTIFLSEGTASDRNTVMSKMAGLGVETRPVFYPMHQMPPYKSNNSYQHADSWAATGLTLPTYEGLRVEDVRFIVSALEEALGYK